MFFLRGFEPVYDYINTAVAALTTYIDEQDAAQMTYIDEQIAALTTYIDEQIAAQATYTDEQIASLTTYVTGDSPVTIDSEDNPLLVAHAYKAQTAGIVTAIIKGQYQLLTGFVGDTNDPAGAGQKVGEERDYNSVDALGQICFFVGKDKYFEITSTGTPEVYTWTPVVVGGDAPIDQD